MKAGVIAFLLIISHTMAAVPMEFKMYKGPAKVSVRTPDVDLCPLCIQFAGQFINQLLNIILQVGVVGSCGEICGILAQEVNSNVAGEVCDILCSIAGIEEFIKIIEEADLDPIYYCELLKQCRIFDGGDAKITSLKVPPKVVKGSTFQVSMTFVSRNGTGTGEIAIQIDAADGLPLGNSQLVQPQQPGTYTVGWNVQAEPDPDCDPTQAPCEQWIPGNYSISTAICNGQCGSKHPHSQIYDEASADFTVVIEQK